MAAAEKLAQQLEQIVLARIASDTLVLPTIPAVALKVLEVLKDPDVSFKRAAEILEKDPVLAARALRQATSAAFAGSKKISLTEALARLGARTLKMLLVEASAQKLFVSRDPKIAEALKRTWEHSVAVGTVARDLLALNGQSDGSEAAYLAGLLHDVGKPVVATLLLEAERQTTELYNRSWIESGDWLEVVSRTHRKVGQALSEKWQLPDAVGACIRDCSEYDNSDRASLVNVVCFANAIAKKSGVYAGAVDQGDVDAVIMIGRSLIGVNDELLRSLTKQIGERVAGLYD